MEVGGSPVRIRLHISAKIDSPKRQTFLRDLRLIRIRIIPFVWWDLSTEQIGPWGSACVQHFTAGRSRQPILLLRLGDWVHQVSLSRNTGKVTSPNVLRSSYIFALLDIIFGKGRSSGAVFKVPCVANSCCSYLRTSVTQLRYFVTPFRRPWRGEGFLQAYIFGKWGMNRHGEVVFLDI